MSEDFDAITRFVERELDFATSHYNDSYLDRRIKSRMRRTKRHNYPEYFELLRESEDEQQALLDAFSINVTGFFRNPEVWDGIRSVLRRLAGDHDRLRVWSAGCADGREPYSLAMLVLDDPAFDASTIDIVGTDINEAALRRARRGVYEQSHTTDIDEQLSFLTENHQYVERADDEFRLREPVRNQVTFERHDLINDPPKRNVDLVVCRNLFIYIAPEHKRAITERLYEALSEQRYLVIGKAETLPRECDDQFDVVDGPLRIYRRD